MTQLVPQLSNLIPAARLMADNSLSALLVRTRDGPGIVIDVDLRDKVIAMRASSDTPKTTVSPMPTATTQTVPVYFRVLAEDVSEDLSRCGFPRDSSGVLAENAHWRMPASGWVDAFTKCVHGWDTDRLLRAAIGFDFARSQAT